MLTKFLALRLEGPLQAWGLDSEFNIRNTHSMPTKSAIAGMICAAFGYPRGSEQEKKLLQELLHCPLTTIRIPRKLMIKRGTKEKILEMRRMQDFHTIRNTVKAQANTEKEYKKKDIKETHLTTRYYLNDASFGAVLSGPSNLLQEVADALKDPVWGVWLGRKTCVPTSPVFAGVFDSEKEALKKLCRDEEKYFMQKEVAKFEDGVDTLPDQALSFDSAKRKFTSRRIKNVFETI